MCISITIQNTYRYGMAITATTSILTGNDWQYAKDIRPGDWVFNRLGKPVKVKLAQMYRSEDCYRVTFSDYLTVEGDTHLAFPIEDRNYREHCWIYKGKYKKTAQPKVTKCSDLSALTDKCRQGRMKYSVPTTEPIQLPHQPLDIPPFIFGFWFIARKANKTLTVPVEFSEKVFTILKENGYKIEKTFQDIRGYKKFTTQPSIWTQLAGKIPTKMPLSYLNGSHEQRLELIQGILCARHCKKSTKQGYFTFKSSKKHISTAFQYLSESLGAVSSLTYDKHANTYDVNVHRLQPFLPEMAPARPYTHYARRYVKSIEPIPAQLCVHIETDDEDGSFLTGEGFIPCH